MKEDHDEKVNRGGRPRFTDGRVTVRLPANLIEALLRTGDISGTIRRALDSWFNGRT